MLEATSELTRRRLIGSVLGLGAGIVICGGAKAQRLSRQRPAMTVHRDPGCGCCTKWAEAARQAGFAVTIVNSSDMAAIKRRHGVPKQMQSCHTSIVGGYAIEGHVPLKDVMRLIRERPANIRGIGVPGMPRGAPGMEVADGSRDSFEVLAFDRHGKLSVYRGA